LRKYIPIIDNWKLSDYYIIEIFSNFISCLHYTKNLGDDLSDGFGIDEENDGDALLQFTQDKNLKKHDYVPNRSKKVRTETSVVKRLSEKIRQGKSNKHT
jgi:hypothetical protein